MDQESLNFDFYFIGTRSYLDKLFDVIQPEVLLKNDK